MSDVRNDYQYPIQPTTDRPSSDNLIDLHVYVMPQSLWRRQYNLALNDSMDQCISQGFIRVPPYILIEQLREEIEYQCGEDVSLPRNYVFVRSVGRCFTIVKKKQEKELKAKAFRPPTSSAPEIFLLEGKHSDYLTGDATFSSTNNTVITSNPSSIDKRRTIIKRSANKRWISEDRQFTNGRKKFDSNYYSQTTFSNRSDLNRRTYSKLNSISSSKNNSGNLEDIHQSTAVQQQHSNSQNNITNRHDQSQTNFDKKRTSNNFTNNSGDYSEIDRTTISTTPSELNHRRREEEAALIIQSSYRGYVDRKYVKELRNEGKNEWDKYLESDNGDYVAEGVRKMHEQNRLLRQDEEDLVKRLKALEQKLTLRRKTGREPWKKKYFEEKRKTPPKEAEVNRQENLLRSTYRKLKAAKESVPSNGNNNFTGHTGSTLSLNGSLTSRQVDLGKKNHSARIDPTTAEQNLMGAKTKLTYSKLKLALEIRLRNQAEKDIKILRSELMANQIIKNY
ncbi:hypothetical protein SNEBB_007542 [Seison nebaliae]|nr:hypothetical protein SNEBB_007542 [Seison nebaliae]